MIKFPMQFEVTASSSSPVSAIWASRADDLPPIPTAIPPQFMGPGQGYSPEDLFALSVLNCLIATYKVYAEKGKCDFENIEGRAILTVDTQNSKMSMTHLDIFISVQGSSDPVKARTLLDTAIQHCAVSNSVKSGKTFHITVS